MERIRGKTQEELNSDTDNIKHVTNFMGIEITTPAAPQIYEFIYLCGSGISRWKIEGNMLSEHDIPSVVYWLVACKKH